MNSTQDSPSRQSGGGPYNTAKIDDGECRLVQQQFFMSDEHGRKRQSIHAEFKKGVESLGRTGSPAPPMNLLTGDPHRTSTQSLHFTSSYAIDLASFNLFTKWGEQVSSKRRMTHVGQDNLSPADRKPMFKGSDFRPQRRRVSISTFVAEDTAQHAHSPVRRSRGSPLHGERSNSSLGSSQLPSSARGPGRHLLDDSDTSRSKSSLGFARARPRDTTIVKSDVARSQLDRLKLENLREMTASQTPDQLQQMATWSASHGFDPHANFGSSMSRSRSQSSSQVAGVFLAKKYSPAQLGADGYGMPASLPEDLDELLNRHRSQGNPETKRAFHETLRSSATSTELKRKLKILPLYDGFINPTSAKILRLTMTPQTEAFSHITPTVVSKVDLLNERAQDVMHDTPAYKKHTTGFRQHANPRIHAPAKNLSPAVSEKAKFKTFTDHKDKMAELAAAVQADSVFHEPKGVRLCSHGGVGFYPIPAGGGRSTRAVTHKLDSSVGYHKYLNANVLETKKDHKCDIPRETDLGFTRVPLILDDKTKIARDEEPLKGRWKPAPDLYPSSLVPTGTRHRFLSSLSTLPLSLSR